MFFVDFLFPANPHKLMSVKFNNKRFCLVTSTTTATSGLVPSDLPDKKKDRRIVCCKFQFPGRCLTGKQCFFVVGGRGARILFT